MTQDEDLQRIQANLQQRLSGRVRELSLTRTVDRIVLRGLTETYYAKQLAQTIVLEHVGPFRIENEINVA
jgi:hypothetical protein